MLTLLGDHRPADRCMQFKARVSLCKAEDEGWVEPGTVKLSDRASEGEYRARMAMFFDSMSHEGASSTEASVE